MDWASSLVADEAGHPDRGHGRSPPGPIRFALYKRRTRPRLSKGVQLWTLDLGLWTLCIWPRVAVANRKTRYPLNVRLTDNIFDQQIE